jgi:hypothetical protein
MSLDMTVMNLNKREFCLELIYIAVSHIRKAGGINFLELFNFEHFKYKKLDIL